MVWKFVGEDWGVEFHVLRYGMSDEHNIAGRVLLARTKSGKCKRLGKTTARLSLAWRILRCCVFGCLREGIRGKGGTLGADSKDER